MRFNITTVGIFSVVKHIAKKNHFNFNIYRKEFLSKKCFLQNCGVHIIQASTKNQTLNLKQRIIMKVIHLFVLETE